jgi:hypothetical protein
LPFAIKGQYPPWDSPLKPGSSLPKVPPTPVESVEQKKPPRSEDLSRFPYFSIQHLLTSLDPEEPRSEDEAPNTDDESFINDGAVDFLQPQAEENELSEGEISDHGEQEPDNSIDLYRGDMDAEFTSVYGASNSQDKEDEQPSKSAV